MVFTHYTKDNTRFVSSVHSTLDGMVCRFQQLEQMSLQDGNREHLIDWLGEVSTKEDYETVLSACEDGTCEWLLQCSEFQEWANRVGGRFSYSVRFLPVGPEDTIVGSPTQMGVFEKQA